MANKLVGRVAFLFNFFPLKLLARDLGKFLKINLLRGHKIHFVFSFSSPELVVDAD